MILVCSNSGYSMIQPMALPGSRGLVAPRGTGCLARAQMSNNGKSLIVGKLQLQVAGTVWRVRWLKELREPLEQQKQSGLSTKGWNHLWETLKNSLGRSHSPSPVWAPVSSPSGDQISTSSISQPDICLLLLSWDQECNLQWFAAVLFLVPWGRDSSVNNFSICLNLPEHPWVLKA